MAKKKKSVKAEEKKNMKMKGYYFPCKDDSDFVECAIVKQEGNNCWVTYSEKSQACTAFFISYWGFSPCLSEPKEHKIAILGDDLFLNKTDATEEALNRRVGALAARISKLENRRFTFFGWWRK